MADFCSKTSITCLPPISFWVKTKVLTNPYKALLDLVFWGMSDLISTSSFPPHWPLAVLRKSQASPASNPLHWLFHLLGSLFPQIAQRALPHLLPGSVRMFSLSEAFPGPLVKLLSPSHALLIPLFHALFPPYHLISIIIYSLPFFCFSSSGRT